MQLKKRSTALLFTMITLFSCSQKESQKNISTEGKSASDFPELIMTDIPGAPILSKPVLISGEEGPILAEGMGWAAPAVYDWDSDGKKDLLIGEFASGFENPTHQPVGNFIRIYTNKGTDTDPRFTNEYHYARPQDGKGTGTPLSVYTWCCIGFTPQIVDLNNDGVKDIVTGQYNPGLITWFKGVRQTDSVERGFLPGVTIRQEGEENETPIMNLSLPSTDTNSNWYWSYSAVSFGDFDGDGRLDMVVGGSALRLSENIGTKESPRFGYRKLLMDIAGQPLKFSDMSSKNLEEMKSYNMHIPESGALDIVPFVVDWDNDGILDILATDSYDENGKRAIVFFKGLKTKDGLRFKQGVALFSAKDGGKAFPGTWLRVCVTDWNNDGVNDLLIGTSVATLNGGKFDHDLSWTWENETKITKKSPAYYTKYDIKEYDREIAQADSLAQKDSTHKDWGTRAKEGYYGKNNYTTLVHRGYVYIMLGKKN